MIRFQYKQLVGRTGSRHIQGIWASMTMGLYWRRCSGCRCLGLCCSRGCTCASVIECEIRLIESGHKYVFALASFDGMKRGKHDFTLDDAFVHAVRPRAVFYPRHMARNVGFDQCIFNVPQQTVGALDRGPQDENITGTVARLEQNLATVPAIFSSWGRRSRAPTACCGTLKMPWSRRTFHAMCHGWKTVRDRTAWTNASSKAKSCFPRFILSKDANANTYL